MLFNIKSKYIIEEIFSFFEEAKKLEIIRYNKKIQEKMGVTFETYKDFGKIEIEITMEKDHDIKGKEKFYFIHYNEKDELNYHIYFDDNEEEAKRNYIKLGEKVSKVKIIINRKVKTFFESFHNCILVKRIKFIKYNRKDITRLSQLFYECIRLKDLDITKLNMENVTNINGLFQECEQLTRLDLSNMKTVKIKDMSNLFKLCAKLRYLDLSSFDTSNVKHMTGMFSCCFDLEEIKLSNFDTHNVVDMANMFNRCKNLSNLDISHFNLNNVKTMKGMFAGTNEDLITKVKEQNKELKDEAFE